MNKIELLALDFDGVIANSILECAVSGKNGYKTFCGGQARIASPSELSDEILGKFRATRPFIRNSEDYLYIYQAIEEGIDINSQEQFDEFLAKYTNRAEEYSSYFFGERQRLLEEDQDNWLKLSPLYCGMIEFLDIVDSQMKLEIVSTKASIFIEKILQTNNINLAREHIHQAGRGKTKSEIITQLARESGVAMEQVVFVDDHVETCVRVREIGVETLLATWGYNNAGQREYAVKNDVRPVELEDFYEELKQRIV